MMMDDVMKAATFEPQDEAEALRWWSDWRNCEGEELALKCAFYRHRQDILTTASAEAEALKAEVERLRGELEDLRSSRPNEYGLVPCPKCKSTDGPQPYWWQRGQAWVIICRDCKHEEGRESTEGLAREVWNRAALTQGDKP